MKVSGIVAVAVLVLSLAGQSFAQSNDQGAGVKNGTVALPAPAAPAAAAAGAAGTLSPGVVLGLSALAVTTFAVGVSGGGHDNNHGTGTPTTTTTTHRH